MKLAIVIPAYNEEKIITTVIKKIPKKIPGISKIDIIVVDDGSKDKTAILAKKSGAKVFSHLVNQGVGAATITGFEAAKKIKADIVITLDADGQHDSKEITRLIKPILEKKADIVLGSRNFQVKKMPLIKIIGNLVMSWLTFVLYNLWIRDSQSGFKAISKGALEQIKLISSGYEICSELVGEIKRLNLRYIEVPVKTIYTPYSKKRGQIALNGINILTRLITKAIIK